MRSVKVAELNGRPSDGQDHRCLDLGEKDVGFVGVVATHWGIKGYSNMLFSNL